MSESPEIQKRVSRSTLIKYERARGHLGILCKLEAHCRPSESEHSFKCMMTKHGERAAGGNSKFFL